MGLKKGVPPTERQRQLLGVLLQHGYVAIRALAWKGKAPQAADLADALHNIPAFMFAPDWNWNTASLFLEGYYEKYPDRQDDVFNLLSDLRRIEAAD
jgi:hypothetical protein